MAFGIWAVLQRQGASLSGRPDYTHSTGDIYHALTINMIQATRSLDPLALAAVHRMPGQPSWVPDWAAHDPETSRGPFGDLHDRLNVSYDYQVRYRIDESRRFLTVRALLVGVVSTCVDLLRSSETYLDSERDKHLSNMRLVPLIASLQRLRWLNVVRWNIWFGVRSWSIIRRGPWTDFCVQNEGKSPEELLGILQENTATRRILADYIKICNRLFPANLAILRSTEDPSRSDVLDVQKAFQVGDLIIDVPGLTVNLIVRPFDDGERTVELVCAVERLVGTVDARNMGNDVELQRRCVDSTIR